MISVEKVDFLAVPVSDYPAADKWFGDTLGLWERNPRSTDRWIEYEAPNVTVALVPDEYRSGDDSRLPFAAFAVRVDDVEETAARLDGQVDGNAFDSGVCKGAPLKGLDGNGLLLHHRYAPFADGRSPEAPSGRIDFVAVPVQDRATVEQFYGEMQFDSYRELGALLMSSVLGEHGSIEQLFARSADEPRDELVDSRVA